MSEQQGVSNVVPPPDVGPQPPGFDDAAYQAYTGGTPREDTPNPDDLYSEKHDHKLIELFDLYSKQCQDRRPAFERVWWRTLLYLLNRQWIYFERSVNQWVDKRLQKWIPKPVTNFLQATHDVIMSVFASVELGVSVRPIGAAPQDIMAADTANKYEAPLRHDHDMESVQEESDWWLAATGNVAWHVWWDYSGDSTQAFVQFETCTVCKQTYPPTQIKKHNDLCPQCGSPMFEPATDQFGQPVGQHVTTGHGCTDVLSPFEYGFPMVYSDPYKSPVLIRWRWRTKEYFTTRYDKAVTDKIQWETQSTQRSLQLLRALASTTDVGSIPNSGIGGEPTETEGTTEAELWMKPNKDYPDGLVARFVGATTEGGGMVLRLPDEAIPGPLPFRRNDGRYIWPWIFIGYQKFGGRAWKRSPLELLIEKQNQLNQLDSLIQLMVQRTSNPVWLEPKGAGVSKRTGEPGLVITYNPIAAGGTAKPERIPGQNIPSSLTALRTQIIDDIRELAGTANPLGGNKPAGVDAFAGMQLMVEQAQSRYGPVLKARGRAYRRWYSIALDMERAYGPDDRAVAILGPNGVWTKQAFQKANLDGSIRVEVEDGSQMPKTSLGTRAAIQQMQALGVIKPDEPETAYRILQIFGRTDLSPTLDAQVVFARREQDAFEKWAATVQFMQPPPQPIVGPDGAFVLDPQTGRPQMQQPPPVPLTPSPMRAHAWDDPRVHITEHIKWACGDAVQALIAKKPILEQVIAQAIGEHRQQAQSMQMPIPPKVTFSMRGQDLADPQVREVFDRYEQITAAPPPAGIPPKLAIAASSALRSRAQGQGRDGHGVGAGRAMHNSNQEAGNPNDLQHPRTGHEPKPS